MAANQKYTNKEIIAALRKADGLISVAAKKLGCDRLTIYNRAKRNKWVANAIQDARESLKDDAEGKLRQLINAGELGAVTFTLKYLGRDRGYVERQELTGVDGKDLVIKVMYDNDGSSSPEADTEASSVSGEQGKT